MISFQGFYQSLKKLSSQKIDERGWHEKAKVRRFSFTKANPWEPPPQALPTANPGRNRYARSHGWNRDEENPSFNWNSDNHQGPSASAPGPQGLPLPTSPTNRDPARKAVGIQPVIDGKPIQPEVRFTLRSKKSSLQNTTMPPRTEPETGRRAVELQEAREKLKQLLKKREEAEKANNTTVASDLTYYTIPHTEARIQELERGTAWERKPNSQRKQARAPPTEVKTDSSQSSSEERGSKAHDSDASLAVENL
ncbi:MAG: hypothetical protein Q9195_007161 [Heterodermia aff. obscurata]